MFAVSLYATMVLCVCFFVCVMFFTCFLMIAIQAHIYLIIGTSRISYSLFLHTLLPFAITIYAFRRSDSLGLGDETKRICVTTEADKYILFMNPRLSKLFKNRSTLTSVLLSYLSFRFLPNTKNHYHFMWYGAENNLHTLYY